MIILNVIVQNVCFMTTYSKPKKVSQKLGQQAQHSNLMNFHSQPPGGCSLHPPPEGHNISHRNQVKLGQLKMAQPSRNQQDHLV